MVTLIILSEIVGICGRFVHMTIYLSDIKTSLVVFSALKKIFYAFVFYLGSVGYIASYELFCQNWQNWKFFNISSHFILSTVIHWFAEHPTFFASTANWSIRTAYIYHGMCAASGLSNSWEYSSTIERSSPRKQRLYMVSDVHKYYVGPSVSCIFNKQHFYHCMQFWLHIALKVLFYWTYYTK